jgi:hypothetical protein
VIGRLVRWRFNDARIPMVSLFAASTVVIADVDFWATALIGILPLLACLFVVHHLHQRVTPLEMTLPIPGRSALAARLVSLLAPVLLPILVWTIATWLRAADRSLVLLPIEAALVATIALVLPNLLRARAVERPPFVHVAGLWVTLGLVVAALHLLLPAAWIVVILVPCTAATVAFVLVTAPPSYAALAVQTRDVDAVEHASPARARPWWVDIARHSGSLPAVYLNLMLMVLAAMGANLMIWLVVVLGASEALRMQQRWMAELPFSARQRFLAVAVPSVFLSTACIGLGRAIPVPFLSDFRAMGVNAPNTVDDWDEYESRSSVPLAYWQRARSSNDLTIVAPWGERAPVYRIRLLGATYVNPYSIVGASSERFAAWQFARATTAVYGRPITRAEYRADRAGLPRRTTGTGVMVVLQGGVLLSFGLLLLWSMELGRWRHRRKHLLYSVLPALSYVMWMSVLGLDLLYQNAGSGVAVSLVQRELLQLIPLLPTWTPARYAVSLVLVAPVVPAAYLLAEWQFRRAELPKPGRW